MKFNFSNKKMTVKLLIALGVLIVILAGVGIFLKYSADTLGRTPIVKSDQGVLWGKLTDKDKKPLYGVRVITGNQTAFSDSSGNYYISPLNAGYHTVYFYYDSQPIPFADANISNSVYVPGGPSDAMNFVLAP